VTPLTNFYLVRAASLSDDDRELLTQAYLPIIGALSVNLYMLFYANSKSGQVCAATPAKLLGQLNTDFKNFETGQKLLEGLGLLDSYEFENEIYFELKRPLASNVFFANPVLSVMLYEAVGEVVYEDLIKKFVNNPLFNYRVGTKTTLRFDEVFSMARERFDFYKTKIKLSEETPVGADLKIEKVLDFNLLNEIIKSYQVALTPEICTEINALARFYAIDEITVGRILPHAIQNHEIDLKKLKRLIHQMSESHKPKEKPQGEINQDGLAPGEIHLANEARKCAPYVFMTAIKKQNNGMVSANEKYTIENVLKNSALTSEVVNIMIYYILVMKENTVINSKFVDVIANGLLKAKAATAEDAIRYFKNYNIESAKRQAPRKPRNNAQAEKIPEHLENVKTENKLDAAAEEALRKQLENL
jgi:replication initiation and membrane attachment protein